MDDDVSYEPETLTYQARVEADGGEIIDLDAINDLYVAGIDSITLSFSNSYGLSKNANNKITKYFDLSDNDLDFAQSDTSKSPTYLESTLNGYSSASYDGVADFMLKGNILGSTLFQSNKGTLTFVIKQAGTKAENGLFDWKSPNQTNEVAFWCTYQNVIYFDYGDEASGGRVSVAQPTGWDDDYHIIQFYRHVNVAEIWVDGTMILNTTFSDDLDVSQTSDLQNPSIGQRAGNTYFQGEIVEGIITNGVNDASIIRTFLATKYGL